jgi:tryptophanyl-tRNA synthetase
MANPNVRVEIPRNAEETLDLASKINKKHTAMTTTSPLNALQTHTWAVNGPQVATALALHQQAEDLKRQAEEAYRKRDLLMGEIKESILASRDLLLGVYRDNPKILGEWGFEVNDSVAAAKKAKV